MSNKPPSPSEWEAQATELLRHSEQQLPSETQLKLHLARRRAVAAAEQRGASRRTWYTVGAGGGALAAAALVLVMLSTPQALQLPNLDEEELAAAQDVELLEELEFVAWMLAMEEDNAPPSQG